MAPITLQSPEALYLLWLLPGLAFAYVYGEKARRRARERFAAARAFPDEAPGRRRRAFFLRTAAVAGIVLALARPGWDPRAETRPAKGREVVFLLDVSRSMLATDLAPNRLERAKLAIGDCLEKIQGDRVALLAFAGSSRLLCPLTVDYNFFRAALREAAPESVERGGSLPGDALRKVGEILARPAAGQGVDVVLLTDGGDAGREDESFAVAAAEKLAEKGARLLIVGLGDAAQGQRIPVLAADGSRNFLQYQGREVWDRLHGALLRRMAATTPGGLYLDAGTGNFDLGEIYAAVIATAEKNEFGTSTAIRYQEKFPLFLAAALLLLAGEMLLAGRGRGAAA